MKLEDLQRLLEWKAFFELQGALHEKTGRLRWPKIAPIWYLENYNSGDQLLYRRIQLYIPF